MVSKEEIDEVVKKGYEIKKEIGKGGFGVVYLATRLEDNKDVAIKKIDKKVSSTHVQREVNALKTLKHGHIVEFFDEFIANRERYIVMRYCKYGTLRNFVLENGKLKNEAAAYVMRQLVKAVQYIHSKKMMHRDLSAQNILIDYMRRDGVPEVRISDFGLATEQRPGGQNTVVGTPGYIPANVYNRSYTMKTDVFALGGVLFLMLTQKDPPKSEDDRHLHLDLRKADVCQEGKDLIMQMRDQDESKRISLEDISKTRFMEEFGSRLRSLSRSCSRNSFEMTGSYSSEAQRPYTAMRRDSSKQFLRVRSSSRKPVTRDSAFESGGDNENIRFLSGSHRGSNPVRCRRSSEQDRYDYGDNYRRPLNQERSEEQGPREYGIPRGRTPVRVDRQPSFSRNSRSTDPCNTSDIQWPLLEYLDRIPSRTFVARTGRFIFKRNGPVIYEFARESNVAIILVIDRIVPSEKRQRLRVFKPKYKSSIPSEDDPEIQKKSSPESEYNSLEEMMEGDQFIIRLYKTVVATFKTRIEKVRIIPTENSTARLMLSGVMRLKFSDGRVAWQKKGSDKKNAVYENNAPATLTQDEWMLFDDVYRDILILEDAVDKLSVGHSLFEFPFVAPCKYDFKYVEGNRYDCGNGKRTADENVGSASNIKQRTQRRPSTSRSPLAASGEENKVPTWKRLPPDSYDLWGSKQGLISSITLSNTHPRKKLRLSTTKKDVVVYEDGDETRRIHFDRSEKDFSKIQDPLLRDLLYTFVCELNESVKRKC